MNQIGLRSVSSLFASTLTFYGHTVMNQIGLSDLCHHLCLYTYILWSYSNEPDWTQICVITLCLYTYILWSYSNEPDWTQICVIIFASTLTFYGHTVMNQIGLRSVSSLFASTLTFYGHTVMNQIGLRSVSSLFASTLTFYGHTVMNQIGLRSVSSLFASTLTFYGHTVMNQIRLSDLSHHLCLYTYILWSYSNEPDWTQICVITLCLYT